MESTPATGETHETSVYTNAQAYEIPGWAPALGESVRNRPEVTPKRMSRPWPLTFELAVPPAGTGPTEVTS